MCQKSLKFVSRAAAVSLAGLLLAGCTTPTGEPNNTGTGALVGGVSGAGLGALLAHHEPGAGALIGGAVGAVTGGLIGNSMDQHSRPPVYVAAPPPPPAPVVTAPPPHYVWVDGQWVWNGAGWMWVPAHWALVP